MPALATELPLSVLPNNTAVAPLDASNRKSHDKTISGVFTYTNGTDLQTGLPKHRLEQLKTARGASQGSLTNVNGIVASPKSMQERVPQTDGADKAAPGQDYFTGAATPSTNGDGLPRTSIGENAIVNNNKPELANGHLEPPSLAPSHDRTSLSRPQPVVDTNAHTLPDNASISVRSDSHDLSSSTPRRSNASGGRLSSPPAMTTPLNPQNIMGEPGRSSEMPRLTQRHTLQVPRLATGANRTSRDFSFASGVSEEVLSGAGRFSPTREQQDGSTPRRRRASLGLVRRTTRTHSDAYIDEIPLDEDAARWTEVIKQKRASRRRRREEEEDDDRVIVGKKVEEGHQNWVTAYNMLTGIRFTVSRTNAKMDRELTDADFDAKHKFSFDVTGNELTPSAKYDFKFKDYSPWVFRHLRAIFGLDPADYLMSLTSKYILSELGSPGKSGSFFYFSRDYKYIIKTIHHAEHKLLRKILREYYTHVKDNPNTLISQFFGLHRVKMPYTGRKIHFIVMNNLFPPHRDIHSTFDLKGSTVGRDFKEEDLEDNPRATLKDLNWLRRDLHLEFERKVREIFLQQLQRDVALLQRLQIMDYSLLVGMHDMEKGNNEKLRETTLQVFQPGGEKDEDGLPGSLMRTPSRLESARKARELRQTLKKEKPVPMGQILSKMPQDLAADSRQNRIFYSDDGGIRATHEDSRPGDLIYYLGVIDCLTHYGVVKRLEHFWKGLSNNSSQISPIPPQAYGERFLNFITGITMTKEEAERRATREEDRVDAVDAHNNMHHHHIPPAPSAPESANGAAYDQGTPQAPETVEKTMSKAQSSTDKQTSEKGRRRSEEEDVPERTLLTQEHEGRHSATLPVVEETREGSSSISARSASDAGNTNDTEVMDLDQPDYPHHDTSEEVAELHSQDSKRISKPPRIASGIIPTLSPLSVEGGELDDDVGVGRAY